MRHVCTAFSTKTFGTEGVYYSNYYFMKKFCPPPMYQTLWAYLKYLVLQNTVDPQPRQNGGAKVLSIMTLT